jgi:hypothetical protein
MPTEIAGLMIKVDASSAGVADKALASLSKSAKDTGAASVRMSSTFADAAKAISSKAKDIEDGFQSSIAPLKEQGEVIAEQIRTLYEYKGTTKAVAEAQKELARATGDLSSYRDQTAAILEQMDALQESGRGINAAGLAYKEYSDLQKELNAVLSDMQPHLDRETALKNSVKALESNSAALRDQIGALKDGESVKEVIAQKEKELAEITHKSTAANEEYAASMIHLSKTFEDGRRLVEEYMSPLEMHKLRISEINEMLKVGAIDQGTYNAAIQDANNALIAAESGTAGMDRSLLRLIKSVGVGAAALKSYQFAMSGVADAKKNVMAQARLEGVLRATGGAAGLTARQLSEMSRELANNSIHSYTATQEAQAIMLTFGELGGEVFPRALTAASDMSAIFGTLESAASAVGMALNDPVQGLTRLSRQGVRFSEEQKAVIASMVETGNVAGAQAIILEELEGRFGGVSKAIADTPAGKLQQLKNEYSDIRAEAGERLIPALVELQKVMNAGAKVLGEYGGLYGIAAGGTVFLTGKLVAFTAANKAATVAILAKTKAMMLNPLFLSAAAIAGGITLVTKAIKDFAGESGKSAIAALGLGTAVDIAKSSFDAMQKTMDEYLKTRRQSQMTAAEKELDDAEEANRKRMAQADQTNEDIKKSMEDRRKEIAKINAAIFADERALLAYSVSELRSFATHRARLDEESYKARIAAAKDHVNQLNALQNEDAKRLEVTNKNKIKLEQEHEKERTEIRIRENQRRARLAGEERDVRAALLRQMELDQMGSVERERATLLDMYNERKKLFPGGTEERDALDDWYDYKLSVINQQEAEIKAATRKSLLDSLKSEEQLLFESMEARLVKYREYEAEGLIVKKEFDDLKAAAEQQYLDKIEAMRIAKDDAQRRAQAELDAVFDILRTAEEMAVVSYERRRDQALADTRLTEGQKHQLIMHYQSETSAKLDALERKRKEAELLMYRAHFNAVSSAFKGFTDLMSASLGEQFAAAKAFNVAMATVNIAGAIASAAATSPFLPAGLAAIGVAMSQTAGLINTIKSTNFSGGYWDGGRIPPGRWGIVGEHGPEITMGPATVVSGNDTAQILDALQSGSNAPQPAPQSTQDVTVNITDGGGVVVDTLIRTARSGELDQFLVLMAERGREIGAMS